MSKQDNARHFLDLLEDRMKSHGYSFVIRDGEIALVDFWKDKEELKRVGMMFPTADTHMED